MGPIWGRQDPNWQQTEKSLYTSWDVRQICWRVWFSPPTTHWNHMSVMASQITDNSIVCYRLVRLTASITIKLRITSFYRRTHRSSGTPLRRTSNAALCNPLVTPYKASNADGVSMQWRLHEKRPHPILSLAGSMAVKPPSTLRRQQIRSNTLNCCSSRICHWSAIRTHANMALRLPGLPGASITYAD